MGVKTKPTQQTELHDDDDCVELPFKGEILYWHKTGRREGSPAMAVCMNANGKNGQLDVLLLYQLPGRNPVLVGVPHVTDPRLHNPQAAKHVGAWELTEYSREMKLMFKRVAAIEACSGMIANRKPKGRLEEVAAQ